MSPSSLSLSRRGLLGLASAGAAAVALPGCAGSSGTSPVVGQPRSGGRLRAVFSGRGATEVLDPHQTNLYVEIARSKALFDKLADYGSDMSPQPRLAQSWEPSADLRTWRITVREASFHDGRPVQPADVLESFARIAASFRTRSSAVVAPAYRTVPSGRATSRTGIMPRRNVDDCSPQNHVFATTAKGPESRIPRANSPAVQYGA